MASKLCNNYTRFRQMIYLVGRITKHDQYKPFVEKLSIYPEWDKLFTEHNYNFYQSPNELYKFLETIIGLANEYVEK